MNRALKIAGIVAAILVALLLSLIVLVKVLITPERVRKTVLPIAEKSLNRQIQLGDIKVSIFSGIVLNDLTVMEKTGPDPFIHAKKIKLDYQFWPLLSKRVVIDEVELQSPQIKVVRLPDGTFNYSDMIKKKEPAQEPAPEEKKEIDLLVSQVAITGGQLTFEDRKGAKPAVYTVTGVNFTSSDISMDKPFPFSAKAEVMETVVKIAGKAANIKEKPSIEATVDVTIADLRKLAAALPPKFTAKAKQYDPSGAVTARVDLAGPVSVPKSLLKDGEIKLDKVQVTASGQRPVIAGDIALKADSLSSRNITVAMGNNKLQAQFAVSNLFTKPIIITSDIKADRFDIDPFLAKGQKAPAGGGQAQADKPEPGPMKLPVRASGTAQIGQTAYKGLPVTQLFLKYRLVDNVLTIDDLKGNVAGGSFGSTARVDLGKQGFIYSTKLKVQGVQANPVVSAFAPRAAGTVFGTLSLNAGLNGSGTKPPALTRNLSGKGDFTIADGKLTGAGLVASLADFINLEQLRVLQFSRFAGTFRIEKGQVIIDSGVSGKDVQITPNGTAGLDKTLNLSLITRLSPALTGKIPGGDIRRFVADDKGWGVLPLKVTGTFSAPKFSMDKAAVTEQFKSKAKEKLQQTIDEKLFKQKEGEPPRPERELLQKGLKGIFGK